MRATSTEITSREAPPRTPTSRRGERRRQREAFLTFVRSARAELDREVASADGFEVERALSDDARWRYDHVGTALQSA
jgi:hypothetical protein